MHPFLDTLDEKIAEKHLLKHPFYQAWTKGELSKEALQEYAREYYHHVKAFPTYLSALHSHTEDLETRKALLKNLIEEEGGSPNHPELWKRFAEALGVPSLEGAPGTTISSLIDQFRENCADCDISLGIASLYAYESQIPFVCHSKIEGLKQHYQMNDPKAWKYFTVHIDADQEHAAEERKLLSMHVIDEKRTLRAAEAILDHLWNFLSGLCHRHAIACA